MAENVSLEDMKEEAMKYFREYREDGYFSLDAVDRLDKEQHDLYLALKKAHVKLEKLYRESKRNL